MGDVACPKRRDMFDRLRRRIELYKRRHTGGVGGGGGGGGGGTWGPRSEATSSASSSWNFGEDRRQEIQMLQQKWQETKAKRAAVKTEKPSNSSLKRKMSVGADLNCLPSEVGCSGGRGYDYDNAFQPPAKSNRLNEPINGGGGGGGGSSSSSENQLHGSVSVNIVHNIDASLNQTQGEIKLTFSSTVNARPPQQQPGHGGGLNAGGHPNSDAQTAYDDAADSGGGGGGGPGNSRSSQNSHSAAADSLALDDLDELSEFLDHLGGQEEDIPNDILKDLDQGLREFEEGLGCDAKNNGLQYKHPGVVLIGGGVKEVHANHLSSSSNNNNSGKVSYKTNLPTAAAAGIFVEPMCGGGGSRTAFGPVFCGEGRVQVPTPGQMTPFAVVSPRDACAMAGAPPLMGDTGPAAETLKQMAAQHQSQENAQYGGMTEIASQYGRGDYCGAYGRSGGMTCSRSYPAHGSYGAPNVPPGYVYGSHINGYQPGGSNGSLMPNPAAMPKSAGKMDPVTYRMTRPLSHYPEPMVAMPSSLQKLQNQVQSHFGPTPQQPFIQAVDHPCRMEMSQNQQLHQQHAAGQHICMSNTQQMTFNGACAAAAAAAAAAAGGPVPHISMSQHQSFSMRIPHQMNNAVRMPPAPPHPPPQQQPPSNSHPQAFTERMTHHGGGGCYDVQQQKRSAHQRYGGWMSQRLRNPSSGFSNVPPGSSCHPSSSNPLQTIQNMVDQHDQMDSELYQGRGLTGMEQSPMGSDPGGGAQQGASSGQFAYFQASQQQMLSINAGGLPDGGNGAMSYTGTQHPGSAYGNTYAGNLPPYETVMYGREQGSAQRHWNAAAAAAAEAARTMSRQVDPVFEPGIGCPFDGGVPVKHQAGSGGGGGGYAMHSMQHASVSQVTLVQQQQQVVCIPGSHSVAGCTSTAAPSKPPPLATQHQQHQQQQQSSFGRTSVPMKTEPPVQELHHQQPPPQRPPSASSSGVSAGFAPQQQFVAAAAGDGTDCLSLDLADGNLDCGIDYFNCVGPGQTDLSFMEEIFSK